MAFIHFTTQVVIGPGYQAYIYLDRLCPFYPIELTFLQNA
jgi:hypothetical protein